MTTMNESVRIMNDVNDLVDRRSIIENKSTLVEYWEARMMEEIAKDSVDPQQEPGKDSKELQGPEADRQQMTNENDANISDVPHETTSTTIPMNGNSLPMVSTNDIDENLVGGEEEEVKGEGVVGSHQTMDTQQDPRDEDEVERDKVSKMRGDGDEPPTPIITIPTPAIRGGQRGEPEVEVAREFSPREPGPEWEPLEREECGHDDEHEPVNRDHDHEIVVDNNNHDHNYDDHLDDGHHQSGHGAEQMDLHDNHYADHEKEEEKEKEYRYEHEETDPERVGDQAEDENHSIGSPPTPIEEVPQNDNNHPNHHCDHDRDPDNNYDDQTDNQTEYENDNQKDGDSNGKMTSQEEEEEEEPEETSSVSASSSPIAMLRKKFSGDSELARTRGSGRGPPNALQQLISDEINEYRAREREWLDAREERLRTHSPSQLLTNAADGHESGQTTATATIESELKSHAEPPASPLERSSPQRKSSSPMPRASATQSPTSSGPCRVSFLRTVSHESIHRVGLFERSQISRLDSDSSSSHNNHQRKIGIVNMNARRRVFQPPPSAAELGLRGPLPSVASVSQIFLGRAQPAITSGRSASVSGLFSGSGESPVERDIRAAREREDELRREREDRLRMMATREEGSSPPSNSSTASAAVESPREDMLESPISGESPSPSTPISSSPSTPSGLGLWKVSDRYRPDIRSLDASTKQRILATSRIQEEIELQIQKELDLKAAGIIQTTSEERSAELDQRNGGTESCLENLSHKPVVMSSSIETDTISERSFSSTASSSGGSSSTGLTDRPMVAAKRPLVDKSQQNGNYGPMRNVNAKALNGNVISMHRFIENKGKLTNGSNKTMATSTGPDRSHHHHHHPQRPPLGVRTPHIKLGTSFVNAVVSQSQNGSPESPAVGGTMSPSSPSAPIACERERIRRGFVTAEMKIKEELKEFRERELELRAQRGLDIEQSATVMGNMGAEDRGVEIEDLNCRLAALAIHFSAAATTTSTTHANNVTPVSSSESSSALMTPPVGQSLSDSVTSSRFSLVPDEILSNNLGGLVTTVIEMEAAAAATTKKRSPLIEEWERKIQAENV